jgi:hypothetical protein
MQTRDQLEEKYSLHEHPYDPKRGYPSRPDLFYRCTVCGTFMPSRPNNYDEASCRCDHINIDIDAGRLSVGKLDGIRHEPDLFRLEPKATS